METTIKIEEIRIGNSLQFEDGSIVTVKGIHWCGDKIHIGRNWLELYRFAPIPLSIDLLKDWYGFQKWTSDHDIFIAGMFIWLCQGMFICNKNGVIIKSVHQLQNLFYATNNQEIKFVGSLNTEG